MFKKISSKLMLSSVLVLVIIATILAANFLTSNGVRLGYSASVDLAQQEILSTDLSHSAEYLYEVIADDVINRPDDAESRWAEAKKVVLDKLAAFEKYVDQPEEKVPFEKASLAVNTLIKIYELEEVPVLKVTKGIDSKISDIDGEMDDQKQAIAASFADLNTVTSKELGAEQTSLTSLISWSTLFSLLVGAVGALFVLLLNLWIIPSFTKPMREQLNLLKEIAAGHGNLTRRLNEARKDEFGELGHWFNSFVKSLQEILTKIRTSMTALDHSSENMVSASAETAASLNEITASVESIMHMITNQSSSITETSASVEEINKNVASFHTNIQAQGRDVDSSVVSIQEMVDKIQELKQKVEVGTSLISELQRESRDGRKKMDDVLNLVKDVSSKSENLKETNAVISSIASQTNLLAMNAAIEAAHAGDAGKGFSVVADEIRKLAESAGLQAKQTAAVLKGIQGQILQIDGATTASGSSFGTIADQIVHIAEIQHNVQATLETQVESSQEALEIFKKIQHLSAEIGAGSREMTVGTESILDEMNRLVEISLQVKQSMVEITSGTNQINEAVQGLSSLSEVTSEAVFNVRKITNGFILD